MNDPWEKQILRSVPIVRQLIETRGFDVVEDNSFDHVKEEQQRLEACYNQYSVILKAPKDDETVAAAPEDTDKMKKIAMPVPMFRCVKCEGEGGVIETMAVFYHTYATTLPAAEFRLYLDAAKISETSPGTLVIIMRGTPSKQKRAAYQCPTNVYLQLFHLPDLMRNVTKHVLVPKHSKISDEDFQKYATRHKFTIRKEELAKIFSTDPVAMFIGLKPLEICKIERISTTTGMSDFFRICI